MVKRNAKKNAVPPPAPGGVIHTYQKYDPVRLPGPAAAMPDVLSAAFEHLMFHGSSRPLTPEELARAVHIDPSQIAGLGPSLQALIELLQERKAKILRTYETDSVAKLARKQYGDLAASTRPPKRLANRFAQAVRLQQIRDLELLWYAAENEGGPFARQVLQLIERLGELYQVDELAAKYAFTGSAPLSVPQALEIKEELEMIDRLLKQLEEAAQNGQIGVIDLEELAQFAEPGDIEQLSALQQQIQDLIEEAAERQGLEHGPDGYHLTPKAYRLFQSKIIEEVFSELAPARSGRHVGMVVGEGAVELSQTKPYEFGDSVSHMDIPSSMINAMIRRPGGLPVRMTGEDIVIHRTRNTPKCATALLLDMSGSMRHGRQYVNAKRMALALQGLIRGAFPGDFLRFVEVYTFARERKASEIASLMPRPVMLYDPIVRLKVDMSDPNISEQQIPPHFTNLQHGLYLARRLLSNQDTPNRQVILITDGLPTAHFDGEMLYLLYPADSRTENATLREAALCARAGIVINVFLLPSWSQSREDIQFAYRMAESTRGRVFFTSGKDLDRYVLWDYLHRRKTIIA
jgi:uncharacterized protein with von Willebrand factor type A (vWA) domain